MSDTVTVKVNGLADLQRRLEQLKTTDAERIVRRALKESAKVCLSDMVERAPFKTGFLMEHLRVAIKLVKGGYIAGDAFIGPKMGVKVTKHDIATGKRDAVYAMRLIEGQRKGKNSWTWLRSLAGWLEFGTTRMTAHSFIRPALKATSGEMLKTMEEVIKEELKL